MSSLRSSVAVVPPRVACPVAPRTETRRRRTMITNDIANDIDNDIANEIDNEITNMRGVNNVVVVAI
jgi:hypothetical protein